MSDENTKKTMSDENTTKVETEQSELADDQLDPASGGAGNRVHSIVTPGWDILKQSPFNG